MSNESTSAKIGGFWSSPWAAYLVIGLVVLAVFGPALRNEFVEWDDSQLIYQNKYYAPVTTENVALFWRRALFHIYIPLTYSAWAGLAVVARTPAEAGMPGNLNPAVFHGFSILLHLCNAMMVFALLRRFTQKIWPACFGALLWAVHPTQGESVLWASELKGLLAGFWGLLALNLYCTGDNKNENAAGSFYKSGHYLGATACFILAMFSKPSAACLPFVAWCLDVWFLKRDAKAAALRALPWLILIIPFFLVARDAQSTASHMSPPWARPLIALDVVTFYLKQIAFPLHQEIIYGRTPISIIGSGWIYISWLIPVMLAGALWFLHKRGCRAAAWLTGASAVFVAALLPNSGLAPFVFQNFSTVADRYLYLAMIGPAWALAAMLANWPRLDTPSPSRSRWLFVLATVWLSLLAVRTSLHLPNWQSSWALWSYNLDANPNHWALPYNIGAALIEKGNAKEALPYLQKAHQLSPRQPEVLENLGDAYTRLQDNDEAIRCYREAIALNPESAKAAVQLANVLRARGESSSAREFYNSALKIDPQSQEAHYNLATLLAQENQQSEAITHFEAALKIQPNDAAAHDGLALSYARSNRLEEAETHWKKAIELDPRFAPARVNYGTLLAMQGKLEEATNSWQEALKLDPNNAQVHHNLATLLLAEDRTAEAISHWKTALKLKPDYPEAKAALAAALRRPSK